MLSTRGTSWVDSSGKAVVLRGCNLGNWLLLEMWMHSMRTEGIPDQYTMEQVLSRRFGEEAKDRLMETYRRNYITERDFEIIKSFGMNVVRLPILYTLIEDDDHPLQLKPDAWVHIDRAINMAEAEGIYTILDLHGAPGGQNPWDHSGRAEQEKLWGNDENKQRTIWLWREIAKRYRGRSAVAGYDMLNEPYTAPRGELRDLALAIYRAIREVDPDHIIIFPALGDGFEFYGDPKELGLKNVAFTPHFYPGFFGWGVPTVEVHDKWLTEGVREWQRRAEAAGAPLLVGEFNPVLRSVGGAEMTARAFDTYASLGWAATLWSYKVLSPEGGIAGGSWGMVTNPPGKGAPLVRLDASGRPRWDCSFADASVMGRPRFTAPGSGSVTAYLTLKAGCADGGQLDVAVDEVSLTDDSTHEEMVANGGFGDPTSWREWRHAGSLTTDYRYAGEMPAGGKGAALRLAGSGFVNGGVFQALTLQGGHSYTLRGVSRDVASSGDSAWLEVYLRTDSPSDGQDYVATGPAPGSNIDLNSSSLGEIETYFASLSTMDYVIYEELRDRLTKLTRRARPMEAQ